MPPILSPWPSPQPLPWRILPSLLSKLPRRYYYLHRGPSQWKHEYNEMRIHTQCCRVDTVEVSKFFVRVVPPVLPLLQPRSCTHCHYPCNLLRRWILVYQWYPTPWDSIISAVGTNIVGTLSIFSLMSQLVLYTSHRGGASSYPLLIVLLSPSRSSLSISSCKY